MILPESALDSHIAILGKTGSGKSNVAKVIAEGLMAKDERVCIVDPTGTWWGLRLLPNGKPSPYQPVIFGGEHGDLPLSEHHGSVIGEAIATSSGSAIIDTRALPAGQRTRLFTAFAETLLRLNRGPLHLVIDEAHIFMPQGKTDVQGGQMLHAGNNMVSLGRGVGLRITLISQRPQKLHKDALTQAETLIAMRVMHPLDRKAYEDWIGEQGDNPTAGKEIVDSLASLPTGDAWVWSPLAGFLKRVHFPLATTFDSGKPLSRDQAAPTLAPLDTTVLGDKMDAIRQEAQANDPARLKARIADLEREKAKAAPIADDKAIGAVRDEAYAKGVETGFKSGMDSGISAERKRLGQLVLDFAANFTLEATKASIELPAPPPKIMAQPAPKPTQPKPSPMVETPGGAFNGPQTKVLRSLAMWKALGHEQPTRIMVAAGAGYSPSSGNFGNMLGQLRSAGAISYPANGQLQLVAEVDALSTGEALAAMMSTLTGPQQKLFDALTTVPKMTRAQLGTETGYSPSSGNFGNLLGQLRSRGLIEYPAPGEVALQPWVGEIW